MKYLKAPKGFTPNTPNPFSKDGGYGPTWSALFLLDRDDDYAFMGTGRNGLFMFHYCRGAGNIENVVADYLRYENQYRRNVILAFPEDIDADRFIEKAIAATPPPHTVRPADPKYLVHSTSPAAAGKILKDGELKSLSTLLKEGSKLISSPRLGFHLLGEPSDYADHICFTGIDDGAGSERVVAENAAGKFLSDPENTVYTPGVRFYFDCHKLIQDGLDVRLCGVIKVYERLPLDPYLAASISVKEADPGNKVKEWTPQSFTKAANAAFRQRLKLEKEKSIP